uniref:Uncharacterized protein n=1 Tax=Romanomermis culicivorax TaxID=13658 RepID=A0A915KNB6_ROMCU
GTHLKKVGRPSTVNQDEENNLVEVAQLLAKHIMPATKIDSHRLCETKNIALSEQYAYRAMAGLFHETLRYALRYKPKCIWNCDETDLVEDPGSNK